MKTVCAAAAALRHKENPCGKPVVAFAECTFIVLDKAKYEATGDMVGPMVGDVNLFFNDFHDRGCAEAEIMIAGNTMRLATTACAIAMRW